MKFHMSGKSKNHINIILDMIMTLVIIGIFLVKGDTHESFGYTLGILVTIHVILHWKQIKIMYCQMLPDSISQITVLVIFVFLLVSIFSLPGLMPQNEQRGHGGPGGYSSTMKQ